VRPIVTLSSEEERVYNQLLPSLGPYEELLGDSWQLLAALFDSSSKLSLPMRGNLTLLLSRRLQGDLRVIEWAACTGYVIQAILIGREVGGQGADDPEPAMLAVLPFKNLGSP